MYQTDLKHEVDLARVIGLDREHRRVLVHGLCQPHVVHLKDGVGQHLVDLLHLSIIEGVGDQGLGIDADIVNGVDQIQALIDPWNVGVTSHVVTNHLNQREGPGVGPKLRKLNLPTSLVKRQ